MDHAGQVLLLAQKTESLLLFLLISCLVEDETGKQYQNVTENTGKVKELEPPI